MSESLIAIICISDISTPIISSILTKAYQCAIDFDSPATLLLLLGNNRNTLHQCTRNSVTHPPIGSPFRSPFLGWSLRDVAQFMNENADGSIVDSRMFLIADEKTAEDEDTLLLVQSSGKEQNEDHPALHHVRVAADYINTEAVALSVATKDVEGLLGLVDEEGVYRGGRGGRDHQLPKKGGKAPKKQL